MKNILYLLVFATGSLFAQTPERESFAPTPGEYIISAWMKDDVTEQVHTYTGAIRVVVGSNTFPINQVEESNIIDGWVRLIGTFTVAPGDTTLQIFFDAGPNGTYFDDVRIHPFNGSMKSFVYDPLTQRLMAELDENNYATFYEYDNEGGLVRVKKETERGVYTIQETRSKTSKLDN